MKQPIKNNKEKNEGKKTHPSNLKTKRSSHNKRKHPQYGTSKLEEKFAKEFLDKLGVEYVYQFEAKDIGRFFDFYCKNNLLIEIDGDYWHGNPNKYKEEELKGHQKKAQRIDEYKTKWALTHGIPIIHIWEEDINKHPQEVMKRLKEVLNIQDEKMLIKENKKKRH